MVFGNKQPLLAYLTETTLRIYKGDEQLKSVTIPAKKDKIRSALRDLFKSEIPSEVTQQDILIVLGGKLLFQKAYSLVEETVGEEDKEAFYKDLPISENELARNVITTEHKVYLLGTNRSYYEAFMDIVDNVRAVVPLSLFSDDTAVNELTREQRDDILKHTALYEAGDFLSDNPYIPQKGEETIPPQDLVPHEQIVVKESSFNPSGLFKLLGISLVLAALFFGGFVYLDQTSRKGLPSENDVVNVSPTPTPQSEEGTVAKDELTIQVLNGTGTAGQAGEVESLLTEAEFSNISVGNAENQDNEVTEVIVSPRVSEAVRDELQEVLESSFTEVDITEASDESEDDIVITTGTASE